MPIEFDSEPLIVDDNESDIVPISKATNDKQLEFINSFGNFTPIEADRPSPFGEMANGLIAGFNDVGNLATFAGALTADALNIPGLRDDLLVANASIQKNAEQYRGSVERIEDIPGEGMGDTFDNTWRWAVHTIARQLPMFAVGGAGGIGGMAAGRVALKTFGSMAAEVGTTEAAKMVAKRIAIKNLYDKVGAGVGAAAANYPMMVGEIGQSVYEETGQLDPQLAFSMAIPAAGLDAIPQARILNSVFGDKAATEVKKGFIRTMGEEGAKQAFAEGTTESMQALIEEIAVNIKDPSNPVFDEKGISNIINSFAGGALLGGVMGGASSPFVAGKDDNIIVNDTQSELASRVEKKLGATLTPESEEVDSDLDAEEVITEQDKKIADITIKRSKLESELDILDEDSDEYKQKAAELEALESEIEADPEIKTQAEKPITVDFTARLDQFKTKSERDPNAYEQTLLAEQALNDEVLKTEKDGEKKAKLVEQNKRLEAQLAGIPIEGEEGFYQPGAGLAKAPAQTEKEVKAVKTKLDTALKALRVPEGSKYADRIKEAYTGILRPYNAILGGLDINFRPKKKSVRVRTASGKLEDVNPSSKASVSAVMDYEDGSIWIELPHIDDVERQFKGDPEALESEIQTLIGKSLEEEIVHAATFEVLRQEAKAKGFAGKKVKRYARQRLARLGGGLRISYPGIVKEVSDVYLKDGRSIVNDNTSQDTDSSNARLAGEFIRMVVQRMRTGQLTEDLQALDYARRTGTPQEQIAANSFIGKLMDSLRTIKEAIARFVNPGSGAQNFKLMVNDVNQLLDRYDVVNNKDTVRLPAQQSQQTTTNEAQAAPQQQGTTADQTRVVESEVEETSEQAESEVQDREVKEAEQQEINEQPIQPAVDAGSDRPSVEGSVSGSRIPLAGGVRRIRNSIMAGTGQSGLLPGDRVQVYRAEDSGQATIEALDESKRSVTVTEQGGRKEFTSLTKAIEYLQENGYTESDKLSSTINDNLELSSPDSIGSQVIVIPSPVLSDVIQPTEYHKLKTIFKDGYYMIDASKIISSMREKASQVKGKIYGKKYVVIADDETKEIGTLPALEKYFSTFSDGSIGKVFRNGNNQIVINFDDYEANSAATKNLFYKQENSIANDNLELSAPASIDQAYMNAVERGDMDEVQTLFDRQRKKAGYNKLVYRGDKKNVSVFDNGTGVVHTTSYPKYAEFYSYNPEFTEVYELYAKTENRATSNDVKQVIEEMVSDGLISEAHANEINKAKNKFGEAYNLVTVEDERIDGAKRLGRLGSVKSNRTELINRLRAKGFDYVLHGGTIMPNEDIGKTNEIILLNPNQVKSANPIVRDEDGNVIPLSKRFNPDSDLIFNAPAPLLIGTKKQSKIAANKFHRDVKEAFKKSNNESSREARGTTFMSRGELDVLNQYGTYPVREAWEKASLWVSSLPNGFADAANKLIMGTSGLDQVADTAARLFVPMELKKQVRMMERKGTRGSLKDAKILNKLADRLINNIRSQNTTEGQKIALIAGAHKFYGKNTAVTQYFDRVADSLGAKLKDGLTSQDISELVDALADNAGKVAEQVVTSGEFVSSVRGFIKKLLAGTDKIRSDIRKSVARNIQQDFDEAGDMFSAFENIFLSAANAIVNEGGDVHIEKLLINIVNDISFGMNNIKGGRKTAENIFYSTLSEVTRDTLKAAKLIGQTEKQKRVDAITRLKSLYENQDKMNQFIDALENKVAEKFKGGKDNPEFKGYSAQTFQQLRQRPYSVNILAKAVDEVAAGLKIKINDLVQKTWGEGMDKADDILNVFEQELSSDLTPSQVETIVNDIGGIIEVKMAQKYLNALGVDYNDNNTIKTVKGLKKITEVIKDKEFLDSVGQEALGVKNLSNQVSTLRDIAGMSMRSRLNISRTMAQQWSDSMGFPDGISKRMADLFETAMNAALTRDNAMEVEAIQKKFQKFIDSSEARGAKKKRAEAIIEKVIKLANKGMLNEGKLYNEIRQLYPHLRLPEFKSDLAAALQARGEVIERLPNGRLKDQAIMETQNMIDELIKLTPGELATTWMYFSMLSGYTTWGIVNPVSNFMSLMGNTMVKVAENPKNGFYAISSMLKDIGLAADDFKFTMKTGLQPGKLEIAKRLLPTERLNPDLNPIAYRVFNAVQAVRLTRFLGATDVFFNRLANSMQRGAAGLERYTPEQLSEAQSRAKRLIENSGLYDLKSPDLVELGSRLIAMDMLDSEFVEANPSKSQLMENIRHYSNVITFTQEPQGVIGAGAKLISTFTMTMPAAKVIVPFTHVVSNVMNEQLNWTPWGFLRYKNWSFSRLNAKAADSWMTKDANGNPMPDKSLLIKSVSGTVLLGFMFMKGMEELEEEDPSFAIYGPGPSDPTLRKQWMEQGAKPYTFKVGNRYISYLVSPAAMGLAAIGNVQDKLRDGQTPDSLQDVFMITAAAMFNATTSQSFLTGVQDIFNAASSHDPERQISRVAARTASTFVMPNIAKQLNRLFDPTIYQADSFNEYFQRDIPVLSRGLTPMYNNIGEKVQMKGGVFGRLYSTQSDDPFWQVIRDNKLRITDFKASAVLGNEPMTRDQATTYIRESGPLIREFVLTNRDRINRMNMEEAQEYLSENVSKIRRRTRNRMQAE